MRAHPTTTLGRTFVIVWVVLASATAAFLMTAPTATATTYVRGLITTDTTWGFSDTMYVATYHVTVRSPATLTILPGTTVKFDSGVHLYIEGSLVADGTATSAIIFTANNTGSPIPWGGIQFNASSSGSISWSTFDRVDRAVSATVSSPSISSNTVLQAGVGFVLVRSTAFVSSNVIKRASTVGIYANASDARIVGNAINGTGLGIQVEQSSAPTISGNKITNVSGVFAVGILVNAGATAAIDGNTITGVRGVNGGNGLSPGAPGRDGAFAVGIYVTAAPSASITTNTVDTAIGGRGGVGGDADGLFFITAENADTGGNSVSILHGGLGGNGGVTAGGGGNGGTGGGATAVLLASVVGSASVGSSTMDTLAGGDGGRGAHGGYGGNATGVLSFGYNDGRFNATAVNFNLIQTVTGGAGGIGSKFGGNGGSASGIAAVYLAPTLDTNQVYTLQGGRGGDSLGPTNGGRGGDAIGIVAGLVRNGVSLADTISGVTKGAAGTGPPVQASYANGYYLVGNRTLTIRFTVENASLSSVGSYEFYVDNYTEGYAASDGNGTGLGNITLWVRTGGGGWSAYATQPAGNLGQFTFTASADGVYEFATTADDRAGNVQSGPSANNTWTTVDTVRPGSHVNSLSPYQNSASFLVSWAPDAGVTDIATYTIQYNLGTGWTNWLIGTTATSATFNSGNQGAIAFRSIATDRAGNVEVAPAGNDTWTIVDTIAPFSHTLPLPTYETSLGFTVSWGPQFDSSDIASYRVQVRDNGGSWSDWLVSTGTSATFTGQDGHTYEFRSIATDRAGNVEAPLAGNDSWTIVDVTPPNSIMTSLPAFENRLQFAVSWGSAVGTTDIATYTILYDVGAGWTNWLVGTAATTGTFTASGQGVVAFRSIATDRAGNFEPAPAGNDTWTMIDITPPSVTDVRPVGPDTNTTPWIRITFTEGMDRASVEQAFSISPAVDGSFQWSADSRSVTFVPTREPQSGTMYFVVVDTSARDLAGNTMGQSKTFQFETAPGFLATYWWLFAIAAAGIAGTLFFLVRRGSREPSRQSVKAASRSSPDAIIEDVFLLNAKAGLLIKHETRRLRPDVDTDILSGMLTAVQAFVKDALRGDDLGELDEMTVGQMHILIGRGKWLVLAARIEGDGTESWTEQIERCIRDMEDHHWDQLEDWDGDMGLARVLAPYIKKLIQGGYAVAAATRPMRAVSAR